MHVGTNQDQYREEGVLEVRNSHTVGYVNDLNSMKGGSRAYEYSSAFHSGLLLQFK